MQYFDKNGKEIRAGMKILKQYQEPVEQTDIKTLSIAEMIRVLFSYDVVFRTVNVLFIVDTDCRILTVVIAHVACPANEADSTVCLQRHNILGCSFGGFHTIPEGYTFPIRITHKSILDSPGAEKDIDLLFLINEISDCSHYNALLFDLYPKECRKNEPIVTDRFVR